VDRKVRHGHLRPMRKTLTCLGLLMALALPAAAHCDLSPDARPAAAARYVPLATLCVNELPDNARILREMETEFLEMVNAARAAEGLTELGLRAELLLPARFHSLDMAANGFFDHVGPDARSAPDRIALLDRSLLSRSQAENLALAAGDWEPAGMAQRLHQGLMDSSSHRRNILDPRWTDMAIGIVRVGDRVAVTQLFVARGGEIFPPPPPEVMAGDRVSFNILLHDWTPEEAVWRDGRGGERSTRLGLAGTSAPEDAPGEAVLLVRAMRPGEKPGQRWFLNFSGPAITVR